MCLPAHAKQQHTVTHACVVDALMRVDFVHAAGIHPMERYQVIEVTVQGLGQQQVHTRFRPPPGAVACSDITSQLQQEFGPGSLCDEQEVDYLPGTPLQPGHSYVYKVFSKHGRLQGMTRCRAGCRELCYSNGTPL